MADQPTAYEQFLEWQRHDVAEHAARRQRWEAVYDRLTAAGVEVESGRGNEVLLTPEQWEKLADRLADDGPVVHRWGLGAHDWDPVPRKNTRDTCSCGAVREVDRQGKVTYHYPAAGKAVEVAQPEVNTRQDGVHRVRPGSAGSMCHCAVCHETIERVPDYTLSDYGTGIMVWVHVATGAVAGVGADPDDPAK